MPAYVCRGGAFREYTNHTGSQWFFGSGEAFTPAYYYVISFNPCFGAGRYFPNVASDERFDEVIRNFEPE